MRLNSFKERLSVLCEVNETDEIRVSKFLVGLKEDIKKKLMLKPNLTLPMACNLALSLEKFASKKKKTTTIVTLGPLRAYHQEHLPIQLVYLRETTKTVE